LLSISRRTEEHVDESENDSEAETGTASDPQAEKPEMDVDHEKPTLRQRLGKTLVSWLTPIEELKRTQEESSEQPENEPAILLAYLPEPITLYDQGGMPVLPDDLIPLAKVQISEVVRTEARQTLKALLDAGMQIKILAADPPERVSLTVEELGVQSDKLSLVSGSDLLQLRDPAQTIQDTLIFGSLTPAMKAEIVKSLQSQDEHVMVIGSKVSDVPALRQANLATVPKNGVPAAMRLTDIVLLDDSIHVLPGVLSTGQQMISGVLTTFKLYLSQVIMQLILILLMTLNILQHFPYRPVQASVASVFTITIPNIFLVVWASSKRLTEKSIRRQLTRFITPVTLALTALVYGLFLFFSETSNDLEYARLAVTYGLLLAGWLRVLFVQPPTRFWAGGAPLRSDPRIFRVVIFCVLLLIGILLIPFFNDRFYITLLASWSDFSIVVLAVIGWAMILKIIWWLSRNSE
jgi:cation-transporting ATPase E